MRRSSINLRHLRTWSLVEGSLGRSRRHGLSEEIVVGVGIFFCLPATWYLSLDLVCYIVNKLTHLKLDSWIILHVKQVLGTEFMSSCLHGTFSAFWDSTVELSSQSCVIMLKIHRYVVRITATRQKDN